MSGKINRLAGAGTARPSGPAINLPDVNADLVNQKANKLIDNLLAEYTDYIRLLDGPINHDLKSAVDEFITTRRLPPQELLKISKAALKILETRTNVRGQRKEGISEALKYFQDRIKLAQRTNLQRLSSEPIRLTEQEEIFIAGIYGLFHRTDKNLGKLFLSNLGKLEDPISKITDYDLETTLNVILITADQYFRSKKEKSADPCISFFREGLFPKQAENHQYLNLPGKITAKSGSNIMDKSLGITLRRDFAEKLEKLLEAHFSNLNQAQIPQAANQGDSDSPSLSLPDFPSVYKLKPFYEPSQADDQRVANPTNSDTTNPRLRDTLGAIFSNDAGEESAGSSKKATAAPQMSRKQISEWIKELELQTPLLPYLRTACLNAATAKTQLS